MSYIDLKQSSGPLSHEYLFLVNFGDDLLANIDHHQFHDNLNRLVTYIADLK